MADTARRLLCIYVRPTLFAALEARAHEHDQDFDDEVRDILEATVSKPRGQLVVLNSQTTGGRRAVRLGQL